MRKRILLVFVMMLSLLSAQSSDAGGECEDSLNATHIILFKEDYDAEEIQDHLEELGAVVIKVMERYRMIQIHTDPENAQRIAESDKIEVVAENEGKETSED